MRNPLRIDPTRTGMLRKRFMKRVAQRFAKLKLAIYDLVVRDDAFGLKKQKPLIGNREPIDDEPPRPGRWRFSTDPEKIEQFKAWLKTQIGSRIRNQSEDALWRAFIEAGFRRGAARSFDDVRRVESGRRNLDFYRGTQEEFLRSAFSRRETQDKVKILVSRSFDELNGVTDQMALSMQRVLADGLVRGANPLEVARELSKKVDGIGRARAERIARTEIIRAHAEGQLDSMKKLGVEEVGVMVEWSTASDENVCPMCRPLEGIVLKLDEARGMLPRHPMCRCAWVPAGTGEAGEDQQRSTEEIEAAIRESLEAEGPNAEGMWGPGADIDESRPVGNLSPELLEFSGFISGGYLGLPVHADAEVYA